jgi:uncharacterized protein YciW
VAYGGLDIISLIDSSDVAEVLAMGTPVSIGSLEHTTPTAPAAKLHCEERQLLAQRITDAIAIIDRLHTDYESVKAQRTTNADELRVAVTRARAIGRAALRAIVRHVECHGCGF